MGGPSHAECGTGNGAVAGEGLVPAEWRRLPLDVEIWMKICMICRSWLWLGRLGFACANRARAWAPCCRLGGAGIIQLCFARVSGSIQVSSPDTAFHRQFGHSSHSDASQLTRGTFGEDAARNAALLTARKLRGFASTLDDHLCMSVSASPCSRHSSSHLFQLRRPEPRPPSDSALWQRPRTVSESVQLSTQFAMLAAFIFSSPVPLRHPGLERQNRCSLSRSRAFPAPVRIPLRKRRDATTCCVESPGNDWKRGPVDVDVSKEEKLEVLEAQLDAALADEDFAAASSLRDQLLRLQSGSYVSVLSANLNFYKAFDSGSIVDIAAVWLQDPSVTCKHPLGPLWFGYAEVINSFGYLFALGVPSITVTNVRITMRGSAAWVTCEEHAQHYDKDGKKVEPTQEEVNSGAVSATMSAINIFVKRNGQWYLAHHSSQPLYQGLGVQ